MLEFMASDPLATLRLIGDSVNWLGRLKIGGQWLEPFLKEYCLMRLLIHVDDLGSYVENKVVI